MLLHHVGHTANLLVELVIRDLLVDEGIVAFEDYRRLVAVVLQVAVDTVVRDVCRSVFEPLYRYVTRKGRILDPRVW